MLSLTHYKDAYDLLAQIEQEMLTHLSELLVQTQTQDLTRVLTHVLENMRDYGDLYRVMCPAHGDPAMLQKTTALCESALASTVQQWGELDESRIAVLQGFLAAGTSGAFAGWMKNGKQLPPNAVAAFLVKLLGATAHGAV